MDDYYSDLTILQWNRKSDSRIYKVQAGGKNSNQGFAMTDTHSLLMFLVQNEFG